MGNPTPLAEALPDCLLAEDDAHVFEIIQVDEVENETFSNNINEEEWTRNIKAIYDEEQLNENSNDVEDVEDNFEQNTNTLSDQNSLRTPESDPRPINSNLLTIQDMACILSMLKTHISNKAGKWKDVSAEELLTYFSDIDHLNKFLDVEIRVIVRYLKKTRGLLGTMESKPKHVKVLSIAKLLGLQDGTAKVYKKCKKTEIQPLKVLASNFVGKYSKHQLNIIFAEYLWPNVYK